ncbi:excalibur calcium-binding domain-containing protein [Mumia quercus]|uniref:excalibur calcium-binding domain-containing protein n=1 Tax=Mumia quercus TaxID=2976125 RepID=UPI0021D1B8B4|nr:excalibur calcium-binding domain-containing protein [Mumia quercus]
MSTLRTRVGAATAVGGLVLTGLAAATTTTASADTTRTTADAQQTASATAKRVPTRFTNCTKLRKKWPHGVGRRNARDKTTGEPVTTFKRSNRIYKRAMRYNRDLDRDRDKIACEKR